MIYVPDTFQPRHPFPYPPDNTCEFERWYFENYDYQEEAWEYLPIMWTAYYCRHKFGQSKPAMDRLQQYLNRLDRSKKYYTIVQYDNGIMHDLSHLDIKVFSMSGGRTDYPLPLISQEHIYPQVTWMGRDIFMNFIGKVTHPIRSDIFRLHCEENWLITNMSLDLHTYCNRLGRSTFTLCPRGFGPTSFRIQEALQYGSIPVYISDEWVIPHNVSFSDYGVLIDFQDANRVHDILKSIPAEEITRKQAAIPEIYRKYFTYEGNKELIHQEVGRVMSSVSS